MGLCNTENIVDLEWLTASIKAGKALPADKFLLVDDEEAESRYDFSMKTSLENAAKMRQNGRKLLTGWFVHVCKGVAGSKAPPEHEFRLMVEQGGGTWVPSLAQRALADIDCNQLLIITSDPDKAGHAKTKAVKNAVANNARTRTTTWLFGCFMRQEISFEA